jgi:hypothetical protein
LYGQLSNYLNTCPVLFLATCICTLEVEGEESSEEVVVRHWEVPAIGGEDGGVEFLVGEVEPGGRGW